MSISPEMSEMMKSVAEKSAETAANRVEVKVEAQLLKLEMRLKDSFSDAIAEQLKTHLGTTPVEHQLSHRKMDALNKKFEIIQSKLWGYAFRVICLCLAGGALVTLYNIPLRQNFTLTPKVYVAPSVIQQNNTGGA